jgi:hypothetical protein
MTAAAVIMPPLRMKMTISNDIGKTTKTLAREGGRPG